MSPTLIVSIIIAYFSMLILVSYLTGKKTDNDTFFLGNRQSRWYVVAIAMIGASLSGVTFVSVPGWVAKTGFTYMQMVMGYFLGYLAIAGVLLPLFYRLSVTSIYTYLEQRFGVFSYKTGAVLFMLSKTVGAAARLYLMANVLQLTLFDAIGIPFSVTVLVTIALIWLYTFRGGLKTIIWTDALQAVVMVTSMGLTFWVIADRMDLSLTGAVTAIANSGYAKVFEFSDWSSTQHFVKQFFSGAFITIVMTGLDQDMMQKNLTCRNLKEARRNVYSYGFAFLPVNLMFLALGAMLYMYAGSLSLSVAKADDLFPTLATGGYLPPIVGVLFMLGLVAAAYSSADSALASLTTSFSIDMLRVDKMEAQKAVKTRRWVHVGFAVLLGLTILTFRVFKLDTIIDTIFNLAGYTYGPLLGMFAFGLFTKRKPWDVAVPFIALLAPLVTGIFDFNSVAWFGAKMGYEKLLLNGALAFLLLLLSSFVRTPKSIPMKTLAFIALAMVFVSSSPTLEQRAEIIHDKVFTLDSHCDTPLNLLDDAFDFGKRHDFKSDGSRYDIPRMEEGGLDASFFAVFIGQGPRDTASLSKAFRESVNIVDAVYRAVGTNAEKASIALSPHDGYALAKQGKRAIYIGVENGYAIGNNLENLNYFYNRGARYLTLCHTKNNDLCDSSTDPVGAEFNGLSRFGEKVVHRMNQLGMMVDVSHISDSAFYDVLRASKAPVIASHSCARALCDNPRNLTDGMLRALAKNGGVAQMCILSNYVKKMPSYARRDSALAAFKAKHSGKQYSPQERKQVVKEWQMLDVEYPPLLASVKDVADHIDHMVNVAGIDHVGIGTDLDGGGGIEGCQDVSQLGNITLELVRRGYSESDIRKIWGGNFMRVFKQVEKLKGGAN